MRIVKLYDFFKRVNDIIFSFILIVFLLPVFLIIFVLVKLTSKGPAFFVQDRIGKNMKVFKMYKFRSMKLNSEKEGVYSDDHDKRLTKIGLFLRKTSLDELPQLINIFLGKMSFVGPRPILTYHPWPMDQYTDEQKEIFSVRPGLTGWAQINGRKTVEWNKRIELNIWYVQNRSLFLDLKILFLTIFKVFRNSDNENHGKTV